MDSGMRIVVVAEPRHWMQDFPLWGGGRGREGRMVLLRWV